MPSLEKYVQKIHKKLNNERLEEEKVKWSFMCFTAINNRFNVPVRAVSFLVGLLL